MRTMSPSLTCAVCGTVNVLTAGRCIACGQRLPAVETIAEGGASTFAGAEPTASDLRAETAAAALAAAQAPRFVVRVLLPEGDKRMVEISTARTPLGSGLDEVGLPGDPKVGKTEAWMWVEDGRLWVEPTAGALGIYRRVQGEEPLQEGDVVLMGDVGAYFERSPESPPVAPEVQALGGGSASPCGRLWFLRRDGSPGPAHDLPAGKTIVGRTDGHLNFPQDSRLSRRHVRFFASEEKVTVEDLDSRNGTYLRVRRKTSLEVGDSLRIGSAGVQVRSRS